MDDPPILTRPAIDRRLIIGLLAAALLLLGYLYWQRRAAMQEE